MTFSNLTALVSGEMSGSTARVCSVGRGEASAKLKKISRMVCLTTATQAGAADA